MSQQPKKQVRRPHASPKEARAIVTIKETRNDALAKARRFGLQR